jgi:thiol-disulfide isomerase/thioredoxin
MAHPVPLRLIAGLAVLTLAGACAGSSGQIGVATGFNAIVVPQAQRKPVPSFNGATLRPGEFSSSTLRGRVAVVNFWGTWCGPCRREQPFLEKLSKEYAARGVTFVGINARRDQRAAALAYLDEFKVTYPSIFNPDSSIAFRFRVRFMPATFVIDREGRIAAEVIGAIRSEADLRNLLTGVGA